MIRVWKALFCGVCVFALHLSLKPSQRLESQRYPASTVQVGPMGCSEAIQTLSDAGLVSKRNYLNFDSVAKLLKKVEKNKPVSAKHVDQAIEKILREEAKSNPFVKRFLSRFSKKEKLHKQLRQNFLRNDLEQMLSEMGLLKNSELRQAFRRNKQLVHNYKEIALTGALNSFFMNMMGTGFPVHVPILKFIPEEFSDDILKAYAKGGWDAVEAVVMKEYGGHAKAQIAWETARITYYISFVPAAIPAIWTSAQMAPMMLELLWKGKDGLRDSCRDSWNAEKAKKVRTEQFDSWREAYIAIESIGMPEPVVPTKDEEDEQWEFLNSISDEKLMDMTCGEEVPETQEGADGD